jgi:NADPH-dependent curcumin reductase CurA
MIAKKVSREIHLTEYPIGMPSENNFKLVQVEIPEPTKEGNSKKRKYGMCCFGDSYSIRSKKEYERNLLIAMIES